MKHVGLYFFFVFMYAASPAQNVGINNNLPIERLDVGGNMNIASDSSYKIGGFAMLRPRFANRSLFIGKTAGQNSTGIQNLYLGDSTGLNNTGLGNVLVGQSAGKNSFGSNNVIVGKAAGIMLSGDENTIVGSQAAGLSQYGTFNVLIGKDAGYNNQASFNTMIGTSAGYKNQNGSGNVSLGFAAAYGNTNGSNNTNIGMQTGLAGVVCNYNTNLGYQAGKDLAAGDNNTFLGYLAGEGTTSGNKNTLVGAKSGAAPNKRGATAIGYGAYVSVSNAVVIGGDSTTGICINCSDPAPALDIDTRIRLREDFYQEGSNHTAAFTVTNLITITPAKPLVIVRQLTTVSQRYLYISPGLQGEVLTIVADKGNLSVLDAGYQLTPGLYSNIKLQEGSSYMLFTGRAIQLIYVNDLWRQL